jgi:hypothetical protein
MGDDIVRVSFMLHKGRRGKERNILNLAWNRTTGVLKPDDPGGRRVLIWLAINLLEIGHFIGGKK